MCHIDTYVARQPIFDRRSRVYGYELLFRNGLENYCAEDDLDHAARTVLAHARLTFGLPSLTGNKKAFVNFTRQLLVAGYGRTLPADTTVIELLEQVTPDVEVIDACWALKASGHRVALDDFIYGPNLEPLLAVADLVKVTFQGPTPEEQCQHIQRRTGHRPLLLAEQVETWDEHQAAAACGCEYFQGNFFCTPQTMRQRAITGARLSYLRLFDAVNRTEVDLHQLERIIMADVALTHRFLRYLGSAAFPWRARITDIRQGLVLLGTGPTRRWVSLIALTEMGTDKPHELLVRAAVRARSCELLARQVSLADRTSELFLLGALSLLDAMLDQPMDDAVGPLPLSDDLRVALTGGGNALRPVLDLVVAHETAEWRACVGLGAQLAVSEEALQRVYQDAVTWARLALG